MSEHHNLIKDAIIHEIDQARERIQATFMRIEALLERYQQLEKAKKKDDSPAV